MAPYGLKRCVNLIVYTYKKRGADTVARSTIERPSHCPTSRNEQR